MSSSDLADLADLPLFAQVLLAVLGFELKRSLDRAAELRALIYAIFVLMLISLEEEIRCAVRSSTVLHLIFS